MNGPESIDQFEVLRVLGQGGMGTVYLCHDTILGRQVAMKVVSLDDAVPDQQARKAFSDRLIHEARLAAALDHPGIVSIYHSGLFQTRPYFVMQFVDGISLDSLIHSGPIDQKEAIRVLQETAVALDYAHSKGIVHRDIKPANILLSNHRSVKLCDFGIAKSIEGSSNQSTTLIGTLHYIAPERLEGRPADARADQWSLGIVAYQLLTQRLPFRLVSQIVSGPVPPMHELEPALVAKAGTVLDRALSKDPAARFGTCSEFVAALARALGPLPGRERSNQDEVPRNDRTRKVQIHADKKILVIRNSRVGMSLTLIFLIGCVVGAGTLIKSSPIWGGTLLLAASFFVFGVSVGILEDERIELRSEGFSIRRFKSSEEYVWAETSAFAVTKSLVSSKVVFYAESGEGGNLTEHSLPDLPFRIRNTEEDLMRQMNAWRDHALSKQRENKQFASGPEL